MENATYIGREFPQKIHIKIRQPDIPAGMIGIRHIRTNPPQNTGIPAVRQQPHRRGKIGVSLNDLKGRDGHMQKITDKMYYDTLEIRIIHIRIFMQPCRIITTAVKNKAQASTFPNAGF